MNPTRRAKNLKNNAELLVALAGEFDFPVQKLTDYQYRLTHSTKGQLDYYPSTGKALWLTGKERLKSFVIPDIEQFILKNFKQS